MSNTASLMGSKTQNNIQIEILHGKDECVLTDP